MFKRGTVKLMFVGGRNIQSIKNEGQNTILLLSDAENVINVFECIG